jgi:FkbM family methyltransferase
VLKGVVQLKDYVQCASTIGASRKDSWRIFLQETKNFRARFHLAKYNPEKIVSFQTIFGRLFFRDNFGDITNLFSLLYEEEYKVKQLQNAGIILDVGANIGMAAVWFSYHNPDREIFCFEPLKSNADLIRLNCPKAKIYEIAVGAERGSVRLNVDPDQVMASSIPCSWETSHREFEVRTLDQICAEEGWNEIAMLKMDVEGMESEILKGGLETLQKTHQVAIETHSRGIHEETIQCLTEAGLHVDRVRWKTDTTALLFASRNL